MKKGKIKKSVFVRVTALIFIAFLLINLGYYQINLIGRRAQLSALKQEAEEKRLQVAELTNLLESSNEPSFIESAARQRLGYVYSNERVFYDAWGN